MKPLALSLCLFLFCGAVGAAEEEVLTVEQAVLGAYSANRLLKASELETLKAQEMTAAAKSLHFPGVKVYGLASRAFDPITFTVPKGSLGVVPPLGPFPVTDMNITAANDVYGVMAAQMAFPLSQHYKINMAVQARKLQTEISLQDLRSARNDVRTGVEKLFYGILQAQSGIEAARMLELVYEDAMSDMENYRAEKAVLDSDYYKVKAKLLRSRYDRLKAENALADLKRQLNNAMGRDMDTPFSVAMPPEPVEADVPAEASVSAVAQRPDVKRAVFRASQAGYDAKIKKAEYIPDLSLTASYVRFLNTTYIPNDISGVGLMLSWDIFDWGKRGHELEEKRRTAQQAEKLLDEQREKAAIDLRAKRAALSESAAFVQVAKMEKTAADETLRVARDKFEEKAILGKDLYAARAASAEAELNFRKAVTDFYLARTQYRQASGEE